MTLRRIRALVIDDEPLARKRIRALLEAEPEIDVAGEAGSGTEAAALIRDVRPDLVFLDVQMPGMDGFAVLRALAPDAVPLVVFVTAHDDHAIRAFDVHAVDYLLKPVVAERFRAAVRRAIERLSSSSADALSRQMASILERLPGHGRSADRVIGRTHDLRPFRRHRLDRRRGRLRAAHVGKDTHLLRETSPSSSTGCPRRGSFASTARSSSSRPHPERAAVVQGRLRPDAARRHAPPVRPRHRQRVQDLIR